MRNSIINKISLLFFTLFFSVNICGQSLISSPFFNIQSDDLLIKSIVYDPSINTYILQNKIGDLNFGAKEFMSFSDYQMYAQENLINDYWIQKSRERRGSSTSLLGLPKLYIPGQSFDRGCASLSNLWGKRGAARRDLCG